MESNQAIRKGKKRAGSLLILILIFSMCVPVHASGQKSLQVKTQPIEQIQLMSVGTSAGANLSISSGKATLSCTAKGRSKATKFTVILKLQKKRSDGTWYTMYTSKGSGSGGYCRVSRTISVSKGTYRTCARVTGNDGKASETKTYYSKARKY